MKPAGGKLVVAKKGETKSVSGQQLPPIILGPQEVSSFRLVRSRRETAGSVVAYYHAIKEAKRHAVKIGAGEPVTRLRMYFPTEEMAFAAARSELDRRERGAVTVSLALPGRPELAAEAELVLAGFRDGVAGSWLITRVEHSLDAAGYACSVEAELPNQSITPDAAVVVE